MLCWYFGFCINWLSFVVLLLIYGRKLQIKRGYMRVFYFQFDFVCVQYEGNYCIALSLACSIFRLMQNVFVSKKKFTIISGRIFQSSVGPAFVQDHFYLSVTPLF